MPVSYNFGAPFVYPIFPVKWGSSAPFSRYNGAPLRSALFHREDRAPSVRMSPYCRLENGRHDQYWLPLSKNLHHAPCTIYYCMIAAWHSALYFYNRMIKIDMLLYEFIIFHHVFPIVLCRSRLVI